MHSPQAVDVPFAEEGTVLVSNGSCSIRFAVKIPDGLPEHFVDLLRIYSQYIHERFSSRHFGLFSTRGYDLCASAYRELKESSVLSRLGGLDFCSDKHLSAPGVFTQISVGRNHERYVLFCFITIAENVYRAVQQSPPHMQHRRRFPTFALTSPKKILHSLACSSAEHH